MNPNFSVYDLAELTEASRDFYKQGMMSVEEVKFFRKMLDEELN
jgi:hypothetical protein